MTNTMTRPGSSAASTIDDVRSFWESKPLWVGESRFPTGSREFFEEHRRVVIDDCLGGSIDPRTMPELEKRRKVLDLGCGPGFWTVELGRLGCDDLTAADLTEAAIGLAAERCRLMGVRAKFFRENAESLSFADETFSHVNCQGVIHHAPNTEQCVREIARVLEPGGTASISVYYRNAILRAWPMIRGSGALLASLGARLNGRGREQIFREKDVDEIVRRYDGASNPIGKAYSRDDFLKMLEPHFEVRTTYLHFFPARSLPLRLPKVLHRWCDCHLGLMIYSNVVKKNER